MNFRRWLLVVIVLLALVVIFRPIFFKNSLRRQQAAMDDIRIPEHDRNREFLKNQHLNQHLSTQVDGLQDTHRNNSSQQQQSAQKSVAAYILRVGSFQQMDNARQLVQTMRKKGYPAYSLREDDYYRVYVGPILGQKKAGQWQQQLKTLTGNQPMIKSYAPLKDMP